ncbi:fused signal recognition particle receptor [Lachnospiraceae bacterium PF1-21]|uniref:Signal recognition particle receptor FtsY n=1 Tax=Ohessyouella blattaphilus TaxID=2949333 RepID=A0ABT1EEQ2_9FIRM|nr:signal recognition particle-docking protein FtsY [Ohessyouella blattaphilus]MCP1109175.1 signal recognition particle-docking protein FtsY [Ohessyouella blattaphilus]MCR8562569.1 signal recognition particle-docking protein FtsY [Ohessyouella blattaphilus]
MIFKKFVDSVFSAFSKIDEEFYEELEEALIMGDIGVEATDTILEELRNKVKEARVTTPEDCKKLLKESIKEQMEVRDDAYDFEEGRAVLLVIGVNGVGKTTTIGKLASQYKDAGKKVLLAAADTFRAAATEQLKTWAERAGAGMISAAEGADPGSVIFDAVSAAKARGVDVLICDTAGRLHNKRGLMDELGKLNRIIDKELADVKKETLVVLDATTGQNALAQAREFSEVTDVTGVILTKMDGTAKGGIAVAIEAELHLPVKYIGVGEGVSDLKRFDADDFVERLFA